MFNNFTHSARDRSFLKRLPMGRTRPSIGHRPQAYRKDARAKQAKATINKTIPMILKSNPRAREGVENTELIADPPQPRPAKPDKQGKGKAQEIKIGIAAVDTITAALRLSNDDGTTKSRKGDTVGILNMASPLRPGGGFLNGATSQEEFLCMRTTLYPSLQDNFYRLPELGGVWTPGVLIFRDGTPEANELPKMQRRHVGVVSAGMLRFPDVDDGDEYYALQGDKDMVERKMKAVMRIFQSKRVTKLVLGAWGCGAYGNPVRQIATLWKKVLLEDSTRDSTAAKLTSVGEHETWDAVKEVVFAIKDRRMAERFAESFGIELQSHPEVGDPEKEDVDTEHESIYELNSRIEELKIQIPQARTAVLRSRLEVILAGLQHELHGRGKGKELASQDASGSQEQVDHSRS